MAVSAGGLRVTIFLCVLRTAGAMHASPGQARAASAALGRGRGEADFQGWRRSSRWPTEVVAQFGTK